MSYLVCDACGLTTRDRDLSTADAACPRCRAEHRRIVPRFERPPVVAVRPMIDVGRRGSVGPERRLRGTRPG